MVPLFWVLYSSAKVLSPWTVPSHGRMATEQSDMVFLDGSGSTIFFFLLRTFVALEAIITSSATYFHERRNNIVQFHVVVFSDE